MPSSDRWRSIQQDRSHTLLSILSIHLLPSLLMIIIMKDLLQLPKYDGGGDHEDTPRCHWDFNLVTLISSSTAAAGPDTLGVVESDPSGTLLATGGIARKIRLYKHNKILEEVSTSDGGPSTCLLLDHVTASEYCICTPAKLGSLRWKPISGGRVLASGDYDGMVMEYDLESRVPIFERDEHGGRRVWSVDYSHWDPVLGASGSDDGTMQLWDPRCHGGECVAVVQPSAGRSSVCCVEFNPFGGALVAVGCADRKAYGYDVRKMGAGPVAVFEGHERTVTYVRFVSPRTMVSAGTDGCLKMWDVEGAAAARTYRGHVNARSFVGLSAWRSGGLLGCGSESNEVFVYDTRWSQPIWVGGGGSQPGAFVSSVCWKQVADEHSCTLFAGASDGALQVFLGRYKSRSS